ncbi:uncharacterized protein LOC130695774 [Daphnia carinata]|uniref:uncharacterized protein LOC130695774 n=1 Tax=Daphnia carinata TaxID=120202 RepID=UPI00257C5B94|nr:uncharacterized protein LOC130695774 [Daphnia carinata]
MWFRIAFTIVAVLSGHSLAAFLLGYTSESCDDLKPHRIPFVQDVVGQAGAFQPGLGSNGLPINAPGFNRPNPNGPAINGPDGVNVQPILMTTVTPYRIFTVDNRYKKGRALEVRLEGREYFEAFVMEARAVGGGPTNKLPQAGVGRFVSAPRTAMFLSCRDRSSSAVVNAPNPLRMNNLTFTWEAPFQDVGDIYFIASVLLGDRYWVFTSERLLSNPFPGELVGCGIRRTCVRLCGYYQSSPICSLDEAEYVLIIEIDPSQRETQITIGGYIRDPQTYVAFGMAYSDFSLTDMDMSVCMLDRGRVTLGHYYVKQEIYPPFPHAGIIVPDLTDLDNNRIWCRFRRPFLPYGPTSINPTRSMFHYYFKGPKNDSGIYLPESIYKMNISPRQYNITEFYTDVQISNSAFLPVARHLVVFFLLLIGLYSKDF